MAKIKATAIGVYLKNSVTAEGEATYCRVGTNMETLTLNNNPEENSYGDVTQATKQTDYESNAPTVEGTGVYTDTDPVYKELFDMYYKQAVLDDAKRDVLVVYMFEGEDGAYKAQEFPGTTVVVNSLTLNGASTVDIDLKFSMNVDAVLGTASLTANNSIATFTPVAG